MNRITPLDPETTSGAAKELFDGVQAKLGVLPNLFRVLGNAPAALAGYLDFGAALGKGAFDAKLREQIALAVAESNQCGYCLSAHTFVGRKVGLTEQQIADARHANADGGRSDAILSRRRDQAIPLGPHRGSQPVGARLRVTDRRPAVARLVPCEDNASPADLGA